VAKEQQTVGFQIGAETFGLPISDVHEIVRMPEITSVPEAPECVEGVVNLRGKIVPVIDMRKRFGIRDVEESYKNRVLVVDFEGKRVGLIVDSASEVLRIPSGDIEPPPNVFEEDEINYVTGVGKVGDRLIILVDLAKILQKGELRKLKQFTAGQDAAGEKQTQSRAVGA
jgi:purine-binding chemotaxis protein CheW